MIILMLEEKNDNKTINKYWRDNIVYSKRLFLYSKR